MAYKSTIVYPNTPEGLKTLASEINAATGFGAIPIERIRLTQQGLSFAVDGAGTPNVVDYEDGAFSAPLIISTVEVVD